MELLAAVALAFFIAGRYNRMKQICMREKIREAQLKRASRVAAKRSEYD